MLNMCSVCVLVQPRGLVMGGLLIDVYVSMCGVIVIVVFVFAVVVMTWLML